MSTSTSNDDNLSNDDSASQPLISLDGSYGEGGGQILRNSLSYATLLGIPLRVTQIRAGRTKPGLQAQHCASVQLPARLVDGTLEGCVLGSSTITYKPPPANDLQHPKPHSPQQRNVTQNIGTAGSICLLLQSSLPVALFSPTPCHLTLGGGTNASMAPQYDYWYQVFLPTILSQCKLSPHTLTAQVVQRGYFPKGGGIVNVHVQKPLTIHQTLHPIQLTERGDSITSLQIRAFYTGKWKQHQANEMVQTAMEFLQQHAPQLVSGQVDIDVVAERRAIGSGMGLLLVATTSTGCLLAGSALCDRKIQGIQAGTNAANELRQTWLDGGCVDDWLQDQLILYMALAKGTSRMITGSLTLHTQTAIWVAQQLTQAHFVVQRLDEDDDKSIQQRQVVKSSKRQKRPAPNTDYGTHGRIPGRHLIECTGISLHGRAAAREEKDDNTTK